MTPEDRKDFEAMWRGETAVKELIARARAEALEEAAKVAESKCEAWENEGDGESLMASQQYYGMSNAGRAIAAAIRALKEKP